jgi:transcriptional regulator with XRE-family HTH domain
VSVLIEADIDAEIGARLAEIRRRCGLTQRQLAKAVGVELTTVQNWERGRTRLPAKRLAALANALHCQLIDLLMLPERACREKHHLTPRTPGGDA